MAEIATLPVAAVRFAAGSPAPRTTGDGDAAPAASPSPQAVAEETRRLVEQADLALRGERIGFGYEERLGQLYVQVLDRATGEVLREFPPKEVLERRAALREMIGLLLDRRA